MVQSVSLFLVVLPSVISPESVKTGRRGVMKVLLSVPGFSFTVFSRLLDLDPEGPQPPP
jgi:hypothetical protein